MRDYTNVSIYVLPSIDIFIISAVLLIVAVRAFMIDILVVDLVN